MESCDWIPLGFPLWGLSSPLGVTVHHLTDNSVLAVFYNSLQSVAENKTKTRFLCLNFLAEKNPTPFFRKCSLLDFFSTSMELVKMIG